MADQHGMMETMRGNPWLRDIMVAVISGTAVLIGGKIAAGPDYAASMNERLTEVERVNRELQATNTALRIELASVTASLDETISFEDLVCSILNSQPGLNWVKAANMTPDGSVEFRMVCMDAEYRARFEVSPFEYVGETDFEYWPEDVARGFYENDMEVYTTRKPLMVREYWVSPDGRPAHGTLTKFYHRFRTGNPQTDIELIIGHLPVEAE
jgi:hypothetical protein